MRNSYLFLAPSISILFLSFQNVSALADISQPITTSEQLTSVIEKINPTSEISTLMNQEVVETIPEDEMTQTLASTDTITSVNQLADVEPTDWAFQALQSLIERYGVITGYPNGNYRGYAAMTRYEFAAGIKAVLERVQELIASGVEAPVSREDLLTLDKLQTEFANELANLQGRVDNLAANTAKLEANQFSTTTKLTGLVVAAVTAGGFSGSSIIDPTGKEIAHQNPNATVIFRASLNLTSSFSGTDRLLVRLESGSPGGEDNAAGLLEPSFGSAVDFSLRSAIDERLQIARLQYTFTPFKDFTATLGPVLSPTDYFDRNSYANLSFLDFLTLALSNNYLLFPFEDLGAGAVIEWNPNSGPFTIRAEYIAPGAANPNNSSFAGGSPLIRLLYPTGNSDNGLFANPYQTTVEVNYSPSTTFAVRLQYSNGSVFGNQFDVFGANFELALSKQLAIFCRYGYGSYDNTIFGDIHPNYWMAGLSFRDVFVPGTLAGIAASQPFVESKVGNTTQMNFEAFYNLPLSDNIRISPVIQVITNPGNQDSNGTIITGTLRTSLFF